MQLYQQVPLLFSGSPPTIPWSVWAIVINTIQGQIAGTLTHVFEELDVTIPALAYSYAATAISVEVNILRIKASLASTTMSDTFLCGGIRA